MAPNVAMLANVIDGLVHAGALQQVTLICGGKSDGEHPGPYNTPANAQDPRFMRPIFYNDQEEPVVEACLLVTDPLRRIQLRGRQ